MKKGCKTSSYYLTEDSRVVDYAKMKRHGYECADYQLLGNTAGKLYAVDENEFKEMLLAEKKIANDAGIEFSQVHAPWPTDDTSEEKRAKTKECMKRAIVGTAVLDGKYLVVHPVMPFGWERDDDPEFTEKLNVELYTELCNFALDYNIGICVENLPMSKYKLSDIKEIVKFVKKLNLPNLYICIDTGHCNMYHQDLGDMIRLCGDKLKVFHIHDNTGYHDDHTPPYTGTINWDSFKQGIKDIGFNGCLSSEADISWHLPDDIKEYMEIGLANIIHSFDYEE